MEFREYQRNQFYKKYEGFKDEVCDYVIGLSEEAGEVGSIIKHCYWGGEEVDRIELAKELGDVLWYLAALCTSFSLDFDTVARFNQAKLANRYSNKKFSNECQQNRYRAEKAFESTEEYKILVEDLLLERQGE